MIQKDTILRWAQELAKVMAKLLGKESGLILELIDEEIKRLLGLDPSTINGLDKPGLLLFLVEEKGFSIGQLEFLAELLAQQGNLLYEAGRLVESEVKIGQALIIFDYAEDELEVFSFERTNKIDNYRSLLQQISERIKTKYNNDIR